MQGANGAHPLSVYEFDFASGTLSNLSNGLGSDVVGVSLVLMENMLPMLIALQIEY